MPGEYNVTYPRGDTFQALVLTINFNGSPWNMTGSSFRMEFREGGKVGRLLRTATPGTGITLTDPANGVITVDAFSMAAWRTGPVYYDLEKIDGSVVQTVLEGVITLTQDVSA